VIQGVANDTFINDPEMRQRLLKLNPYSFCRIVGTLLEVNGRGYSLGGPSPQQRLVAMLAERHGEKTHLELASGHVPKNNVKQPPCWTSIGFGRQLRVDS
jgi:cobalamin biosynthesis Mg chelatase CobN